MTPEQYITRAAVVLVPTITAAIFALEYAIGGI